jgi:hypothetical protein
VSEQGSRKIARIIGVWFTFLCHPIAVMVVAVTVMTVIFLVAMARSAFEP